MKMSELQKMEKNGNSISFDELPNKFEGSLINEQTKEDSHGQLCLYWTIQTVGDKTVVQKYTKAHFPALREFCEINHITDTNQLYGKTIGFAKEKHVANPKAFPRWLPDTLL